MTLLATLSSMSTMVNSIGPAFQGIGEIAKKMWADLKTWVNDTFIQPVKDKLEDLKIWWAGFKEDVQLKWDILTGYIGEKLSVFWDWLPDLPNIFSLSFWTGLFTSISTTVNEWATGLWDLLPSLPSFLTLSYWTDLFDFDIDWSSIFSFSLPDWLTWDYWFGSEGIFNFDIGSIFGFDSWTDLLPDWSWSDIIPDSLSSFFSLDTMSTAFSGIGAAFSVVLVPIVEAMNFLIDNVNDILGWNPPGPGGTIGNILGVQSLSNLDIPQLAKGGIVNSPTLALIGEAGPEAVVPLSGNNAGMGGTYNITVNAGGITDRTDKRALAREIGNMIQQELSRNTGGNTMRGRY